MNSIVGGQRTRSPKRIPALALLAMLLVLLAGVPAIRQEHSSAYGADSTYGTAPSFRFPIPPDDYNSNIYHSFLPDSGPYRTHLGEDVKLRQGTPVRAIANGRIVEYKYHTYYATSNDGISILAVIEHDLGRTVRLDLKVGDAKTKEVNKISSIYGHIRNRKVYSDPATALGLKKGNYVTKGQIIGYINDSQHGGEATPTHLHMGVFLGGDPSPQWGYCGRLSPATDPLCIAENFAAASEVIPQLSPKHGVAASHVRWHPDGTLVRASGDSAVYFIHAGQKQWIKDPALLTGHSYGFDWNYVVEVPPQEIECYPTGADITIGPKIVKGSPPDVYLIFNNQRKQKFASPDVLFALGYDFTEVQTISDAQLGSYPDDSAAPVLGSPIADGTLISKFGESVVYAITDSRRRSTSSAPVFQDLGYSPNLVVQDLASRVDAIPEARPPIDENTVTQCGPVIAFSPSSLVFSATKGGPDPGSQTLSIFNSGRGTLSWSTSDDAVWLSVSPTSGASIGEADTVTVTASAAGLRPGTYKGNITISAAGASNTPQTLPVELHVSSPSGGAPADNAADARHTETVTARLGQSFSATFNFANTGNTTWSETRQYRLGRLNWDADMSAPLRVLLAPGETVSPGQTKQWTVVMTAPSAPGVYHQTWQMVREGVHWFGDQAAVTVTVPAPSVSVSPGSGQQGTIFTATGQNFVANSFVTSHLRRPDGTEFPTLTLATDASGIYGTPINSATFAPGTYQHWAVDNTSGVMSNVASFTVTPRVNPSVSVSPGSGASGTIFSAYGTGFTRNNTVTSHLRRPDGSEFPTLTLSTDVNGVYMKAIDSSSFLPGTYQHWAVDDATGVMSNVASFEVTSVVAPSVSVSPSSGPPGTIFTAQGAGFTPNSTVTSHLLRPVDISEFPTLTLATDANGSYTTPIDSTGFALGTYQHWAVDHTTSVTSNIASFAVTVPEGPPGDPSCSDGIDNDGDGFVDFADPDCAGLHVDQMSIDMGPPGAAVDIEGNGKPAIADRDGDTLVDAEGYDTPDPGDTPGICGNGIDDDLRDSNADTIPDLADGSADDGCVVTLTARETCIEIIDDGVLNADEDSIANVPQVGQDRASIDITIGAQPGPGGGVPPSRLMSAWQYSLNWDVDVMDVDVLNPNFLILANGGVQPFTIVVNTMPVATSPFQAAESDGGTVANLESGPGVLSRITLEGNAPGLADLTLTDIHIQDQTNTAVPVDVVIDAKLAVSKDVNGSTVIGDVPGESFTCGTATPNQPPLPRFDVTCDSVSGHENQTITVTVPPGGSASCHFSAVRSFDPDGTIAGYEWRISGTLVATTRDFDFALGPGTHQILLTVRDNSGLAVSVGAVVEVVGSQLPEARFDVTCDSVSGHENQTITVTVPPGGSASCHFSAARSFDPDGTIAGYEWRISGTLVATTRDFDFAQSGRRWRRASG